ncbi:MAG: bifunctional GTP diphosphokinase/guanosine-3',5'-bis pyrophosphate 3'-pyrophosphohydrolase [Pseudohongiellaceae bacterium]|jgi:GTP diphosphokinase / guanosine-3',5'-bis(diphosphate) 3'-diphosphatase
MQTIETLASQLSTYLEPAQVNLVKRAYYYAAEAHDGQTRRSGEPYVTHPLAVAQILQDMHMDHQSLMAAMLHDVIEDTGLTRAAIAGQFGEAVANLVDGVSKLNKLNFSTQAEVQAENFQKMALAMAKDIRVILVKLADRLHNMRTLDVLSPEKRRRIARETIDIYAPIANRLGIHNIRLEFEELSFHMLYPMRAPLIEAAVKSVSKNRKELVSQIQTALIACLKRENLPGRVVGREKHLFSIYQKMKQKKRSFREITDVFAFRIVTDQVDTCYRILGAVHNLYKPVPGKFKDYIAIPKVNGYQSLHTTLFGMHGVPIEIQIRTEDMEAMANNGIAAHWLYKSSDNKPNQSHIRARQWVLDLLEMQKNAGNSLEFIEHVKTDLFPDEIYVFTPKGKIMELPAGSTPVDFAYAVHTDVGNACVACRINRTLAPLSEPLQSGQTVEIIASGTHPNPSWLSFVVTGKARSNIRHFLKNQRRSEAITLGRRLLNKTLSGYGYHLANISKEKVGGLLEETNFEVLDDLLEDIGLGNRMAFIVARRLLPSEAGGEKASDNAKDSALAIRGTEGLLMTFSKCCHPIPGDPIIGFLSAGRGMIVHTENCRNVAEARQDPKKVVPLRWDPGVQGEFSVELRVEVEHQRGIIATLANTITSSEANIEKISMSDRDAQFSIVNLTLTVRNRIHLARVMKRVRVIRSVSRISRVRN